jgi:hypothetical protein
MLFSEEIANRLLHDLAANFGNRFGQWNVFRANLHAVLRVAAFLDAAVSHEGREALALEGCAGRMRIEQAHLRDRGCSNESRALGELRTGLHAATARDATRERVGRLLRFGRLTRAGAEVVGAVDRNPRFDLFQVLEEHAAVDGEIAHDGELREWLELDGLIEMIEQRRAGHPSFAIDDHGARAAHFFEAIRVVGDGRSLLAVTRDGIGRDVHERRSDVHVRPVSDFELLPGRGGVRGELAFDLDDYGFVVSH